MAKVISKVQKYDLPSEHIFALKQDDLTACFSSQSKKDVYLDVVFQNRQSSDKKNRERLEGQGIFQLVKLKHDPTNGHMTEWQWANGPWKDVKKPIIIEAWIYGVPRRLCTEAALTQTALREILLSEVKKLLPKNGAWGQKKLTLRLLAKEQTVECTATTWHAEQPKEVIKLVKLGKAGKAK